MKEMHKRICRNGMCQNSKQRVEELKIKGWKNNKKGMELVQVAILVAIAIGLGLLFRESLGEFISNTFNNLNDTDFGNQV